MDRFGVPDTGDGRIYTTDFLQEIDPPLESKGTWCSVEPSVKCCPVCNGKGIVAPNFYDTYGGAWSSAGTGPETCRSCDGKGYIIVR